jgi:hypothetical protein
MGHRGVAGRGRRHGWTRVWPLPRQFPPGATPNCPARGSVPGAVASAAREPARLQGQPDPIVASGRAASAPGPAGRLTLPGSGSRAWAADRCCSGRRCAPRCGRSRPWRERSRARARPGCSRQPLSLLGRAGVVPAAEHARTAARSTPPASRDRLAKGIVGGAVPHRCGGAPHPGRGRSRWRSAR